MSAATAAAAEPVTSASRAAASSASSYLYYTTRAPLSSGHGLTVANVWRARFSLAAGKLRVSTRRGIAFVPRARSILTLPDGRLLVGSFGSGLLIVDPQSGRITSLRVPEPARQVVLAPSGRAVWGVGRGGALFEVPLVPHGRIGIDRVRGVDRAITSIAFGRSGRAYYTAEGGDFGTLDLRRLRTRRVYEHLLAAEKVVFDRYTGDLLLTGHGRVVQVDPKTFAIRSNIDVAGAPARRSATVSSCNQASTGGSGTVIFACGGALVAAAVGRNGHPVSTQASAAVPQPVPELAEIAPTFTAVSARSHSKRRGCKHFCTPLPLFTG